MVVLGGSVPPGLTADVYAELVSLLRTRGVRTVVDTAGKALTAVLPARPTLIKPNAEEAGGLVGRPLTNDEEIYRAAEELRSRGAEYVVISLGAEGAIAVGPTGGRKAVPPCVVALSAVGSGDSMVAGMAVALAEGGTIDDMLRLGTAAGAATAKVPGTQLGDPREVARLIGQVRVCVLEPVETPADNAAG